MRPSLAGLALGLLITGGCNGAIPPPRYPQTDARAALALHERARAQVLSIRAEARVDQRGDGGRIKGTVLMFVQRPARVRFDVMTQFGPVAILTSDGEHFEYADLRESVFTTGATCPENIARILGLPMTVEQTAAFLLGGTGVLDGEASVAWNPDGFYRVEVRAPDGARQQIDLGIDEADRDKSAPEQRLRLLRSELWGPRGKSVWRARYDDYEPVSGAAGAVMMPFEVQVEQPSTGSDTLIRFKEIALDDDVDAAVFHQDPRPGMRHEEASCDGP